MPDIQKLPQPQPESFVQMLERVARDPTVNIERINAFLEMRERIGQQERKAAFDHAMAQAQSEMDPVRRDASNLQTHSRYASLVALDRALRPIYTKYGFALTFNTGDAPSENTVRVECLVTCAGHRETYRIDMPADGKGAKGGDVMTRTHATGSAVTYGRRYLELMIFNIAVGGEDDDGNAAGKAALITDKQIEHLKDLFAAIKGADARLQTAFLKAMGVTAYAEIPASEYDNAVLKLKNKAKQS